jgi:5'-AMP-activated protein kinase regulatory beta subunit
VTGGFNNWQGKIMMHRNEDNPREFVLVIDIPPGTHQYRFIADEEWQLSPDSPKITTNGVTNNVVEVKRPVFEHAASPFDASDDEDVDELGNKIPYGQEVPGEEAYSAKPLKAPPHLSQANIVLNMEPVASEKGTDPYLLDVPGHELINHLIVNQSSNATGDENVLVTSITQRLRTKASISVTPKFVTLIYYKPVPQS